MKVEFGTINSEDKKKVESLQSVKVRGQSLIAAIEAYHHKEMIYHNG
jgi:hypothetical protein